MEHLTNGAAKFDLFHQERSSDIGSSILLGKAEVPLRGLMVSPNEVHGWFNVVSTVSGGIVGALEVAMYTDQQESVATGSSCWTVKATEMSSSPTATTQQRTVQQETTATQTIDEQRQPFPTPSELPRPPPTPIPLTTVSVGIIRALRLKLRSGQDSAESFATLESPWAKGGDGEVAFVTSSSPGPSPFWGATAALPWVPQEADTKSLTLRVWEGKTPESHPELLGSSVIALGVLTNGMREIHGWYAVADDKGAVKGHVEVLVFPADKGRGPRVLSSPCRCPPTATQRATEPPSLVVQDLSAKVPPPPSSSVSPSKVGNLSRVASTLLAAIDCQL
jgi:hypothetical protein